LQRAYGTQGISGGWGWAPVPRSTSQPHKTRTMRGSTTETCLFLLDVKHVLFRQFA
jgi:hypothetical protein